MMSLWSILLSGIIAIATIFYLFIKRRYSYWERRGIPQKEPIFPYGNFKGVTREKHLIDFLHEYYEKYKGQSPFAGIYMFWTPSAVILDLDLIKNILIKDFNYFTDRGIHYNEKYDPLTAHLFALDGVKWKRLRNKLSPTFTSGKMKFMFQTVLDVGDQFAKVLEEQIKNEPDYEMKDILARFGTDVIGSCAFGIECNSLKNPDAEFRRMGKKIFENRPNKIKEGIANVFPKLAKKIALRLVPYELEEFFVRIVRETIEYRQKNNIVRNDFMQLLMQLKKDDKNDNDDDDGLKLEEIAAQAFLFFVAGYETSSTALTFILYELGNHQDIQNELRKEINNVLNKYAGKMTYEAMKEMTYMDQVINEGLRKYPPVANLMRKSVNDYEIPDTDHVIEKGTIVLIPTYSIHYDPNIYPNPNVFDPDRFTTENILNRHQVAWLPFGDGPRNCVGLRFGIMQAKIALTSLLKNFKFDKCSKTPERIEFDPKTFIISSKLPIYLKIEKL